MLFLPDSTWGGILELELLDGIRPADVEACFIFASERYTAAESTGKSCAWNVEMRRSYCCVVHKVFSKEEEIELFQETTRMQLNQFKFRQPLIGNFLCCSTEFDILLFARR